MTEGSEVAKLLRQIEAEYAAAKSGLSGLAFGVSSHTFITAKMERIDQYHQALYMLVGEEKAIEMVASVFEENSDIGCFCSSPRKGKITSKNFSL